MSGSWIGLEDNDSGHEMIKDIPVENVHEAVGTWKVGSQVSSRSKCGNLPRNDESIEMGRR